MNIRFLFLLILGSITLMLPSSLQASKTVRVAVHETKPLSFSAQDGTLMGIYPEIILEIGRLEGWQVELVKMPWREGLKKVENGEVDLLGPIGFTKERLKRFAFNQQTVIVDWGQVYIPDGSKVDSILALAGRRIAIQSGHIMLKTFRNLIQRFNIECEIVPVRDQHTVFKMVAEKQVAAGAVNRLFGLRNEKDFAIHRSPIIYFPIEIRFAAPLNGDKDLLAKLDQHLKAFKKDETSAYHRTLDKWLLGKTDDRWHLSRRQIILTLAIGGGCLLLILLWMYTLRLQVNTRTRQLSESEKRFRQLAENIQEVFWIVSPDWSAVHYISPAYEKIWGRTCQSLYQAPLSWLDALVAEDRPKIEAFINEQADEVSDEIVFPEYRIKRADGKVRWILARGFPLRDKNNAIKNIVGVAEDITTRVENEIRIRKANSILSAVVEGTTDAIFMKDLKGCYIMANSTTCQAIGKPLEEIIGKADPDLFPAESAHVIDEVDTAVIESAQTILTEEKLETAYGETYWLVNKSPYLDEDGNIIGLIGISRDITAIKQSEDEKAKLQNELRQAHKLEAIGTLAGGIAHDFNNILGIIIGNTELAMDDVPDWNPAQLNLKATKTASLRARDVVRQLLSFSRKGEQDKKAIRIAEIIDESIKLLRASIPTTIEIRTTIPTDLSTIEADPTQFHQVMLNLCTNASQAMDQGGGVLGIDASEVIIDQDTVGQYHNLNTGRYVQIAISDTGCGIDPDIRDRIFDPYFTTKEQGQGTGIGLSVVHGIVNNHNGAISIYSEPDMGTTIKVLFPVSNRELVDAKSRPAQLPTGTEKILFIDDEAPLAEMGRQILQRLGYDVVAQTDPAKALALFKDAPGQFDLMITDMTMPKMTGIQLAQAIKKITPALPIILCTGFSEKVTREKAGALGIARYIEKHLLASAVREAIDAGPKHPDPTL